MNELTWVCGDCGWETSNADGEEDHQSQKYLHTETTGHPHFTAAEAVAE
jgi:rubredoxin